ncbi:hypothetical protein [Vitiosangium sp. GDMCC 1.1324]|uniref:hypothetical protein n=1 Tax=Vitiosangium sp. (strain GDMCC 1.1324) TaxID=2138576 RepID=UPI000D36557F|nr:hypothetical protein [Vitiosangium sp. GDMCC 1.1324]PTL80596.1 hypothetical protein DAT35_28630 [Vitiosangium sp. GDMCC 1.1324]
MRAAIFYSVLLVGGLMGCASRQGNLLLEKQEEASYEHPLEEVWPSVRSWFQERGFRAREDAANFVLQTDWREEFPGSAVAGYWHRYTVVGKRESPSRCRVWVIRSSRSPDGAPVYEAKQPDFEASRFPGPGNDGLPGGGLRMEEMDVRLPSMEPRLRFVPSESVSNVTLATRVPGVAGESLLGARDFGMEWVLRDAIAPGLDARKQGLQGAALSAARQEPGNVSIECGMPIIGLAGRAQRGSVMLLGELHGTREVPRFVALSACQVSARGIPVTVGLELPVEEQERVRRFIASDGSAQEHALLMESPFWRSPYPDGRSSEAVAQLLEQLRWLRAQGLDVKVFVFDHPELQGEAREAAMAGSILSQVEAGAERFFVIATGNVHPRILPGVPWDLGYRPMGYMLARKLSSLVSLDVAYDSGTAWICSVGETLECGERSTKGKNNGDRYFISFFEQPNESGFHGVFYVGPVSASPPAVRPGQNTAGSHPM